MPWCKPGIPVPVVIRRKISVPAADILSRRVVAGHLPKRHQQAVVAETHQDGAHVVHLIEVWSALQRYLLVANLFQRRSTSGHGKYLPLQRSCSRHRGTTMQESTS